MKKSSILCLVGILILCCLLSGCATSSGAKYTEEIILTKDNFTNYFNVNIYNTDYREEVTSGLLGKEYGYSCIVNIEISKASDFELNDDVCVTYFINSAWSNIAGTYQNEKYHRCVDIKLPSNGESIKKIQCTQKPTMVKLFDEPQVYLEEIKGSIRVKK